MSVEVEIDMKDLLKRLKTLPEKVQKRIAVGGVRASAKPVVQDARSRIHNISGNLAKSIGVTKYRTRGSIVRFSISPRVRGKHDGYYGLWVELGHPVIRKGKKIGFVPAHPFLKPAFEAKGEETIKYFKQYVAKRLDKLDSLKESK